MSESKLEITKINIKIVTIRFFFCKVYTTHNTLQSIDCISNIQSKYLYKMMIVESQKYVFIKNKKYYTAKKQMWKTVMTRLLLLN